MWFEELVGFKEKNPEQVRSNLIIENENIISKVNGKSYQYGALEIPTLKYFKKNNIKNAKKIIFSPPVWFLSIFHIFLYTKGNKPRQIREKTI